MYDDDDDDAGKGNDDDVNRTPTAFAKKNHQQPESYRSSPQKHQAYHGYTGKAMIMNIFQLEACLPGGVSAWRPVRLEACPPGGMSAWRR